MALALLLILPGTPAFASASPSAPLQEPAPTEGEQATVARNANLRAGPGTNFAIVGGAQAGDVIEIVGANEAGSWFELADGSWIWGQLLESPPAAAASPGAAQAAESAPEPSAPAPAAPAPSAPSAPAAGPGESLVADAGANFPGGKERNFWFYLFSEGRNNFNWQEMRQKDGQGCFRDTSDLGLEICSDSVTTASGGDVAIQWKASKGGAYRFEWDSASLKFYRHTSLVGIVEKGKTLPYAATAQGVIDWELFFWVATESGPYRILVYRLEEGAGASPSAAGVQPSAAPGQAPAQVATFGAGVQRVGADIVAGTYRAPGSGRCYWERLSGFGGTFGEIIANEYSPGPQVVTISASDKGFMSRGCGTWTLDLSPTRSDTSAPFGDGTYFVGIDIAPGLWQSSGSDLCYWETLSGFSGEFKDLHTNDLTRERTLVQLRAEDTGFRTRGCGTWSRIE
jgi:uncharacterized protein YgiM (DUF1202 family)